jgi:hypothetical protein
MVLTILVMGLIIIPASAATLAAQRAAAMLQLQRGAVAVTSSGHSRATALPGSGASASAGCSNQVENAALRLSPCGTQASAPVGRQVEREQAAVSSTR